MTRRILLASGRLVDPTDLQPGDIDIKDIAYSLAGQNRFTAYSRPRYNVAEHSCHVARIIEREGHAPATILLALLHDGSEAYLHDVAHPVKQLPEMASYRAIEALTQARVERALLGFEALPAQREVIHRADILLCYVEKLQLMPSHPEVRIPAAAFDFPALPCWTDQQAEREFLARYELLRARVFPNAEVVP